MARNVAAAVTSRSGMSPSQTAAVKDRDADGGGGETEEQGIPAALCVSHGLVPIRRLWGSNNVS